MTAAFMRLRPAVLSGDRSYDSVLQTSSRHRGSTKVGKPRRGHSQDCRGSELEVCLLRWRKKNPEFDYLCWGHIYYASVFIMQVNTVFVFVHMRRLVNKDSFFFFRVTEAGCVSQSMFHFVFFTESECALQWKVW